MPDELPRTAAKVDAQAAIDAASRDFASGAITESTWQRRVADTLALAYLREDDPRWQSGFDGDPDLWREARAMARRALQSGRA